MNFAGKLALAPMAGLTDQAFREICKDFGADYVVTEMVSSKGLVYENERTKNMVEISQKEHPCAIQIFGDEPKTMAKAAILAAKFSPNAVDINMGCPAPKVNKSGGGAQLMLQPELCGEIVAAVRNAVNVPVTVKIRTGYDETHKNAAQVAKICEAAGANALAIHGRTRVQMYTGPVDFETIAAVKRAVEIPVFANGNITCPKAAKHMLERTGADSLMVGRGALGRPWIFREIAHFLKTGEVLPPASITERMRIMLLHAEKICKYKGEKLGVTQLRCHLGHYMTGLPSAASLRALAHKAQTLEDVTKLAEEAQKSPSFVGLLKNRENKGGKFPLLFYPKRFNIRRLPHCSIT